MAEDPVAGTVSPLAWAVWTVLRGGGVWSCPDVRDRLIRGQREDGHTKPGRYGAAPMRRPTNKAVYDGLEELVELGFVVREGTVSWRAAV